MARASTIKRLPPEIRELIDRLRENGVTIDEIKAKLHELGRPVSRSALGRYVKEIDEIGRELRRGREIAKALLGELGEGESQQARLNIELMHAQTSKFLLAKLRGEGITLTAKEAHDYAKSLDHLARARRAEADYALRLRKEIEAEQQKKLAALEQEAAKGSGGSGKRLDLATLKRIREEIYGISS